MPTYEYLCRSCGKRFEAWQKITDEPITVCPNCSGEVHRVIYPVGLMFKGPGFYSTDSRGAAAVSTPAAEGGDTSKAGTPDKGSAPAASEAKTGAGAAASTTSTSTTAGGTSE